MKYIGWVLAAGLFLQPVALHGQETKATKAQKKADKKQEQRIAKDRKADLKGKKRHYKLQDKKTRKKMKRHRRRVDKNYPSDKPGFFRRLFRKKHYYIFQPVVPGVPTLFFATRDAEFREKVFTG